MNDPLLGPVTPDAHIAGCFVAMVTFEGRSIELLLDPVDAGLDACIALAKEMIGSLDDVVARAKATAAQKLLDDYNRNWRDYSRARADGTMEDVLDPVLDEAGFVARLKLVALFVECSLVEGPVVEFCFEDGGLFAGHSVFLVSFDGLALSNTDASLFG